jgi:serine/threonine-protein kinase Chk2
VSTGDESEAKKPRRSARNAPAAQDGAEDTEQVEEHTNHRGALPSPVTKGSTDTTEGAHIPDTPINGRAKQEQTDQRATPATSPPLKLAGLSSPPSDTQPFSQFLAPPPYSYEVEDEEAEGVWGYLVPIDGTSDALVLRKRAACPVPARGLAKPGGQKKVPKGKYLENENDYEAKKAGEGVPSGGYLIGRHPECDRIINIATVSNRHCLLFAENKDGHTLAMVEDLSGNGTYVNNAFIGRNKRRELHDGDELSILDKARFIFRYPRNRDGSAFHSQYSIQGQLGEGHFATVYLATEKNSGMRFAVKKFEKRSGPGERSKVDGLQQEIAVLMGVSHPNMLCLKDTFDERDGVYLVLELAPEGELFNWVVMKQKLTEAETRKVFVQLFQGIKYLVSHYTIFRMQDRAANSFSARAQHRTPRHQA